MPRGFWDWGVNPSGVILPAQISLDELAARLGSPNRYNRLGDVVFMDSYEDGAAAWSVTTGGTGSSAALYAGSRRTGGYSFRLTSGSDGARNVEVVARQTALEVSQLGIEASFTVPSLSEGGTPLSVDVEIGLRVFDGANVTTATLRIQQPGGDIALLTTGSVYTAVGSPLAISGGDKTYHTAKFVIDLTNRIYRRLMIGAETINPTAIALVQSASLTLPQIHVRLIVTGPIAFNRPCNFDDIILTQNEP